MIGGIKIRTELDARGRTRLVQLDAAAPFAAKFALGALHIIGTAAAPVDGDEITFDLEIGAGTSLTVRSVAATMAWPSRSGSAPSTMEIRARIGAGAHLEWLPEPVVPVRRCRHVMRTHVELDPTARLVWREEFILGRANEGPGSLAAHTRIERAGEPLLHQHLVIDGTRRASHVAASILGAARATGSVLVVGPGAPEHHATIATPELAGAVLELEGGGRLASATGRSVSGLRRWLDEREAGLTAGGEWAGVPGAGEPPPRPTQATAAI